VLNQRAVGDQELIYQSFVIGGPRNDSDTQPLYRGDSFLCGAALHAGVLSNSAGGCGVVSLVGRGVNYVGSERNGIKSVSFASHFPSSFVFEGNVTCEATDMRWALLAISVVFSSFLALFVADPAAFFFPAFTGIFWTVGLALDSPSHYSIADLVSTLLSRYLPVMFVAWVVFDKMGVRRVLRGLTAQIEKLILWLGGAWVGALENYTFSWIPIQRLTPHDLEQQPGAKAALAVIILVLIVVGATQIWFFRQEGRLLKYLALYILMGVGLVILVPIPGMGLRIHHYILALLLLPGVSMQTRPCLFYQGLLVGLLINGVARWDFAAILETARAIRGDANLGSPLPEILAPVVSLAAAATANATSNITFTWRPPPMEDGYDGISVLVNDVERFRGFSTDGPVGEKFVWTRDAGEGLDEFFRFAFMQGTSVSDYTKAGIWNSKGEWIDMAPGPSKKKHKARDLEEKHARDWIESRRRRR
jgi:hypothetical protein